ncbi:phenylacetate-CoA ligase [Chitinivorax tropicus]|uniref:Phenylacetate-CoA ligase n=1 Tax=Chitinivorax tropicus TaxID=714531 RepID=A0A840MJR6_9PROT|nr:AMP-binding protein [Chitinivorax tropicus]MBB5018888.1 phenylacetate-CoA ligase [Chitinivorax tropicus]
MGLYTTFAANVLFPLHERLKHHDTVAVKRQLEQTQWLKPEAIRALQLDRLRAFLTDCGQHVPYYRDLFAKLAFDPVAITSLSDLARLPILTKDIIRREFEQLKSSQAEPMKLFSTTGSTGDPLRFFISNTRVSHDVAAKWRATRWWDVDIGDREMVIWSSPIELTKQDRVKQLRDWLLRSRLVPSATLSPADMARFVEAIRRFKPAMLFGYPSSMTLIAQHAEKQGVRLDDLGIKVAFCTAERMYPHQADTLKRVFGCPVANGYGGRDAGFIAHACPQGGYHITAEDIIVEVVDEQGLPLPAGVPGEVVVTHLYSTGFPFVRYKNGDVAVLDDAQCACGRGLPLLKEVRGRTNDVLLAEDGSMVHDVAIAMVLRDMPGVIAFKVIQETLHHCRLQLVRDERFQTVSSELSIRDTFRARLGQGVKLDIEYVAAIEPEKSGKYRYVVSKVSQHQAGHPTATIQN